MKSPAQAIDTIQFDLNCWDGLQLVADQFGVSGWVANRSDGTVSVHAEGADAALTALGAWLEAGPASARVDSVERSEAAVEGHAGFAVRR